MTHRGTAFPPELTVAPKDYLPVSTPLASNYRVPEGFVRVRGKKCSSLECRPIVQFVHKRTRLCLACATKAKIVVEWAEPAKKSYSVAPPITDEQLAERIALARQIRESVDPYETCLPQLEVAMDGPDKNARRNGQKKRIEQPEEVTA